MEAVFKKRYQMLNSEQKRAVDAIDGPVMVVAGPGTGKTQILTLRIANIIDKTDTEPENILALTFTESGVRAMRKRLAEMIGSAAYRVPIFTFHSFANTIIQNNPEDFPTIIGAEPITDVEQIAHLESIIIENEFEKIKPFGDSLYYISALRSNISKLKREGVTVEDFQKIVEKSEIAFANNDDKYHTSGRYAGRMKGSYVDLEKQIQKNKELLLVYGLYQKRLREAGQYDFDDMIVELLVSLRTSPDLLLRLQEIYQYILVDEHQDTNNAQNKILELLANFHDNPNLFVVGDEKQSIFKFQGASLENFFYFKHLYPQAKLITLTQNYRSTQNILDASFSLIPSQVQLDSNNGIVSRPISLFEFQTATQEYVGIAEQIETLLSDGIAGHEIALLYRNNADVFPFADIFSKKGIPFVIESDQSLFEDADIKKILQIARAVQSPEENDRLVPLLLSEMFDIPAMDAVKLIRSASQKRKKLLIDIMLNEKDMLDAGVSKDVVPLLVSLANNLSVWKKKSHNTPVVEMLEILMRESGLLNFIMSGNQPTERVETLGLLFDQARSQASKQRSDMHLHAFLEYIDLLETHNVRIKKHSAKVREGAVRCMTAHKSKGLEFDFVFVVGLVDGVWGNKKKRDILPLLPEVYSLFEQVPEVPGLDNRAGDDDEERRLLYVALTRARKHLTLSFATSDGEGKEMLPSQFVGEINESLIAFENTKDFEHTWPEKQMILFSERIADTVSSEEYMAQMKAFVKEKFESQGLSVSALNNYLKSPWLYFFRNLVRIPSPMNRYLVYGNAVHGALQDFFDSARGEQYPDKAFLITSFERNLEKEGPAEKDFDDLLAKGRDSLSRWYDEYQGSWNLNTRTEFQIYGVQLANDEGVVIKLNGVLDKLEFEDVSQTHVTVVDYKTGKPKTEGEVRGTTKTSEGDYYRQLVFYKLLLRYFADGKLRMDAGVLEFVEPNEKGIFKRYKFEISDKEVDELEVQIRQVAHEILNLSFWNEEVNEHAKEFESLVRGLKR